MRIAQIAPLQTATPPHTYGGTERVVHNLTESLVQLGHEVTLFATGDSQTSARLIPGIAEAVNFDPDIEVNAYHTAMLEEAYRHADEFDIIHSHLDYLTLPFIKTTTTPTVLTLHGRSDLQEFMRVYDAYADANYVAISQSQRRAQPHLNWIATIHHGIDIKSFRYHPVAGDYLCFLGRISPDKRPERAIEIARRAGIPLKIAAKIGPQDRNYFATVVEPLFDPPSIEFLGQLDERGKRELLGNAMGLLVPIDWPEPFGMVFIEALACGTPVITCPMGAAPELLIDGVTGFLRETVDDLVDAVRDLPHISRERCRSYAAERFDMRRMALEYIRVYSRLRDRETAQPSLALPASSGDALLSGATSRMDHVDKPNSDEMSPLEESVSGDAL